MLNPPTFRLRPPYWPIKRDKHSAGPRLIHLKRFPRFGRALATIAKPRKRTFSCDAKSVALGHNRTYAVQQKGFLFDNLVSALLELQRHVEAERFGCL